MQFSTRTTAPERVRAGCALVPVLAGKELTDGGKALDAAHGGRLVKMIRSGDLPAKAGSTLLVQLDATLPRALLVSLGEAREATEKSYAEAVRGALKAAGQLAADETVSLLHEAPVTGRDTDWKLRAQVLIGREQAYRFETLKTRREPQPVRPKRVVLPVASSGASAAAAVVAQASAIANGVDMARDLGNLPGNHCTPTHLADTAKKMARELGLAVEVLDTRKMQALKMGALLSVARGSEQPPKLIVLRYRGAAAKQAPIALVGKGITFDSGGISLKPARNGRDEVRHVRRRFGAGHDARGRRAEAEDQPRRGGAGRREHAGRPRHQAGRHRHQHVGPDRRNPQHRRRGRLILCDALTYVQRFKPSAWSTWPRSPAPA